MVYQPLCNVFNIASHLAINPLQQGGAKGSNVSEPRPPLACAGSCCCQCPTGHTFTAVRGALASCAQVKFTIDNKICCPLTWWFMCHIV